MKSLAHPEWPYTGTPHEWRGFAEKKRSGPIYVGDDKNYYGREAVLMYAREREAVYQKQNFGPSLD